MEGDGEGEPRRAGADAAPALAPSPLKKSKSRSLSDGGGTPSKLPPSPQIVDGHRRTSKDDSNLSAYPQPVTPRRTIFPTSGLSLQMPQRDSTPPPAAVSSVYVKPAPLSPKLDQSNSYASPTNILPRRSRGLDFSRAATSLHHSTLAEQSSPDSSPTMGGRAISIPSRREDFGGGPEQTSSSLWSMMGNQEKMNISHSLGSNAHAVGSDSSSSSDAEDNLDEDMDDIVTTPQVTRIAASGAFGSPAMGGLVSFQQRQRNRKPLKKKMRGSIGLGFNNSGGSSISNSPPNNTTNVRRESISWQANQLHISGNDGDEAGRLSNEGDGASSDGQRNVVRRPVTRRGNLLPKTKNFARIRAALFEEVAPADAECKREAEVVKQVRESDVPDLEPRRPTQPAVTETPTATTALSSPNQESLDDIPEDDMMGDLALGLSSSFKQHAMRNSKGKTFWDNFSETSSIGGTRTTPPPSNNFPRGSSSGMSEDVGMDSPSQASGFFPPLNTAQRRSESQPSDPATTPKDQIQPPSAAEITRRINNKRRRDDDFDPASFKRRAVSPGLSVHNSPLPQSPMQRDMAPWGSRPGSNGGEKAGSSAASESGSMGGNSANASGGNNSSNGRVNSKTRVGFQGMVDTNDSLMRMSIE